MGTVIPQGRVLRLAEPITAIVDAKSPPEKPDMHEDDGIDRPITFEELLSRCLGELEFAQNVLANFVSTCEPQLEGLRKDLENNDWDALSRKVHRLKGTAATIAARPLRESLEQLEILIKSDDSTRTDRAREGIDFAARECERIDQFVQSGLLSE